MVVMREDATAEEIAHVLEEMRKYGVKLTLVRIPVSNFNNKSFTEEWK